MPVHPDSSPLEAHAMEERSERVQVRPVGDALVVRLSGDDVKVLYLGDVIREIGAALYDLAERSPGKTLILNLEGVEYAASEMLGKLASLRARVGKSGGRLRLCGLQENVRESLRITHLLSLFDVCDTEAEALGLGEGGMPAPTEETGPPVSRRDREE
jgi:anti-anti-sigma factor